MSQILVIGASSLIAKELIKQSLSDSSIERVIAVSRSTFDAEIEIGSSNRLCWLQSDYRESSIQKITERLRADETELSRVFICNGVLHNESISPEKRLEDLSSENFQTVMQTNALIPMLWIKHLKPLLKGNRACVVTAFSARVGSIEDNQLGGWYAYRASKAALNMMLKNASIEFGRIAKQTRFLVFHPGTTDTPLSRPFQKSVPDGKLFTPAFVASQLLNITANLEVNAGIDYLDWNGQDIAW